jgi:hypothetical protein
MNSGIFFKNGGPIRWLGERQEQTSLSSCEAKIQATNATLKKVADFRNLLCSVSDNGHTLNNISSPTILYNNNDACVKWSHDMTSKDTCHIELQENSILKWVQNKTLNGVHFAGKFNPADIFTKEMKDSAHFCCLRDLFMIHLSDFMNDSLLELHHSHQRSQPITPTAAFVCLVSGCSSYMAALASISFCRTLSNVSHLCSLGRHLFWKHYHLIPSGLI